MRNKISLREIVLGAILLTATMVSIGCVSNNLCNVDRAYNFAYMISQENPNKYAKKVNEGTLVNKGLIIYHDESLTVEKTLLGNQAVGGKGILIKIYRDGELSVSEMDFDQKAKFESGEINFSEFKGRSFSYMDSGPFGKGIVLFNNGSMVGYIKSNGKWERKCYDTSKVEEGIDFESFPVLSKKDVKEEEVLPYLELLKNIRERYTP